MYLCRKIGAGNRKERRKILTPHRLAHVTANLRFWQYFHENDWWRSSISMDIISRFYWISVLKWGWKKQKIVWNEEEGYTDEGERKECHGLKVKVFRKVERIRGEYKELFLCYVGKFNYFFCLTRRMSVRFSGWFLKANINTVKPWWWVLKNKTCVRRSRCGARGLYSHRGNNPALCHWGCRNSQQLCDPKGSTGTLKGKPKASSCASHATTSTWFLTPHLAPLQLY